MTSIKVTASRRDRILLAAEREFATQGLAGARMERVAASAGVNKQLLFHYFGSKRGLHDAAIAAAVERQRIRVPGPPAGQPSERLRQLISQLQSAAAHAPAVLWLLHMPRDDSAASRAAIGWYSDGVEAARGVLEDAQRSGHFRDDVDSVQIAQLIVSASIGMAWHTGEALDGRNLQDRTRETLLRLVLDYCTWR